MTALAAVAVSVALSTAPKPAPSVEVEKVAFAVGVSSNNPVGAAPAFPAGVGNVYCWNRVRALKPPARIKHVWRHDGETVGEYDVDLRRVSSRLWTFKRVSPGLWQVDILDGAGNLLTAATFIVRPK